MSSRYPRHSDLGMTDGPPSAVPQAAEFLDAQPLSKGKTEKAKKKKNAGKSSTPQVDLSGFMILPAPAAHIGSPAQSGISNGSPAPRPGFSRISSVAQPAPSSKEGTPAASDRTRLVIGLGAKRKAAGDHLDSPPPKRR